MLELSSHINTLVSSLVKAEAVAHFLQFSLPNDHADISEVRKNLDSAIASLVAAINEAREMEIAYKYKGG